MAEARRKLPSPQPKLLLALALAVAAASLPAIAASPAAAFQSEGVCSDSSDTSETCTSDEPGGGIPGDPGTTEDAPAQGDAPGGSGSGGPAADTSSADKSTSTFDWRNDALDPDPFEDPLKPDPYDKERGLLNQPDATRLCTSILHTWSVGEAVLERDQELIRDPSIFTLVDNQLFRAHLKQAWRESARGARRLIRHAQALYDANSCTAVLLPE